MRIRISPLLKLTNKTNRSASAKNKAALKGCLVHFWEPDIYYGMPRVLSIDASTTTIGYAILDYDDGYVSLFHHGFFKPNKDVDQIHMVIDARNYIMYLAKNFNVDEFVIEDYVKFMGGGSTASTIIPLAILNSSLRIGAIEILGIEPVAINVMKIRHTIKLDDKLPPKEDIPELVAKILKIDFPWILNENKRSKKKFVVENYDISDAIACGIAFIKLKNKS